MRPQEITISSGETAQFNATVTAPPETSYFISDVLTINGTAKPTSSENVYDIQSIKGAVRIKQFYNYSLICDDKIKFARSGDQCEFDLRIFNYGNGQDTFTINILNQNDLASNGITLSMSAYTINIPEKEPRNFTLVVNVPSTINLIGQYKIDVEIRSEMQEAIEGSAISKQFELTLEVNVKQNDGDDSPDGSTPGFETLTLVLAFIITIFVVNIRRKI